MSAIKWFNRAALGSLLWFGFVHDVEGARNVALAWVWFLGITSPILLAKVAVMDTVKREPESVAAVRIAIAWRLTVLLFLVWHGAFASAVAWGLVGIMHQAHRGLVRKARNGEEV